MSTGEREGEAGNEDGEGTWAKWARKAMGGCRLLFRGWRVALGLAGEVYSRTSSQGRLRVGAQCPYANQLLMMTRESVIRGTRLGQKSHLGICEGWLRREKYPQHTHMCRTGGALYWAHFPKIISTFKG